MKTELLSDNEMYNHNFKLNHKIEVLRFSDKKTSGHDFALRKKNFPCGENRKNDEKFKMKSATKRRQVQFEPVFISRMQSQAGRRKQHSYFLLKASSYTARYCSAADFQLNTLFIPRSCIALM